MTFDVFISYPHEDKAVADAACAKLEAGGIRCWIAPRDIAPSADWASSIVDAIDNCRVMVLIFSAHTNRSRQVGREVQQAFDGEKPVVPFRIENVVPEKSLRYYMGSVHWLDALTAPLEQHLQKLTASVQALINAAPSEVATQKELTPHDAEARSPAELQRGRLETGDQSAGEGNAARRPVGASQHALDANNRKPADDAERQWRDAAIKALRNSETLAGPVSRTGVWSVGSLWRGRIDRFAYLMGYLICIVAGVAIVGLWRIALTVGENNPHLVGPSGFVAVSSAALSVILAIGAAAVLYILSIRRLHDIGRSGWWSLLGFMPVVNCVLIAYLLLKKGAPDPNLYGPSSNGDERSVLRRLVNA